MRRQELHPRTEIINQKQKNQSKNSRYAALRWLVAKFPKAFDNSESIQPLKMGIMQDILLHTEEAAAEGISKSKLREAVVLFTRRIDYLTSLKAQEMRIDLEGNPVTPVTEEEASKAALKIRRTVEKAAKAVRKPAQKSFEQPLKRNIQAAYLEEQDWASPVTEYSQIYNGQRNEISQSKAAPVIKHKTSRQFDPDAVARLKEKLGLPMKKEPVG